MREVQSAYEGGALAIRGRRSRHMRERRARPTRERRSWQLPHEGDALGIRGRRSRRGRRSCHVRVARLPCTRQMARTRSMPVLTSMPWTVASPLVGVTSPQRTLMAVVLPAPSSGGRHTTCARQSATQRAAQRRLARRERGWRRVGSARAGVWAAVPFCPRRPVTSPCCMSKDRSTTAWTGDGLAG
eukprot:2314388-Prymnesium_polylepis.1